MNSTQLRYRAERAKASRNQRHQETNTLRSSITQVRLWFNTHRKYLRRSGVTRAVVLDNGDLASARIYLEVTSRQLTLEHFLVMAAGVAFSVAYLTFWVLEGNSFGLGVSFWVFLATLFTFSLLLPSLVHRRRYRVVIPFAEWLELPFQLVPLSDALSLAANLDRGYDATNLGLLRALRKTGMAEVSKKPSEWDLIRLQLRRYRRAA